MTAEQIADHAACVLLDDAERLRHNANIFEAEGDTATAATSRAKADVSQNAADMLRRVKSGKWYLVKLR